MITKFDLKTPGRDDTREIKLYTKKDNIITREDATGALPSGQYSGIKVNNYDGNGANGKIEGQCQFLHYGSVRLRYGL